MFFFFSKLLDILVAPLTWGLLLALAGLPRRPQYLRFASGLGALVLYAFSIAPISNGLVRHVEERAQRTVRQGVRYDAVLLLGGMVEHGATAAHGEPSYNDSVERLLVTYDLLRSGHAEAVIVSGGVGWAGDPVVEAKVIAKQLQDWGIARERIFVEDQARNTRENAEYSKRLAKKHGFNSLLLVTSAFHMARALECFRMVDLAVDALPVDYRSHDQSAASGYLPRSLNLDASTWALRELFGTQVYRLVGYGKN